MNGVVNQLKRKKLKKKFKKKLKKKLKKKKKNAMLDKFGNLQVLNNNVRMLLESLNIFPKEISEKIAIFADLKSNLKQKQ